MLWESNLSFRNQLGPHDVDVGCWASRSQFWTSGSRFLLWRDLIRGLNLGLEGFIYLPRGVDFHFKSLRNLPRGLIISVFYARRTGSPMTTQCAVMHLSRDFNCFRNGLCIILFNWIFTNLWDFDQKLRVFDIFFTSTPPYQRIWTIYGIWATESRFWFSGRQFWTSGRQFWASGSKF